MPKIETNKLREKKRINIERLKEGLKEYNEDNKTDYSIVENIEQGSVAMSTVIQNDENDYDIDVAIVFDKDNIGEIGTIAIKNIVVNALKRKCTNFKTEPEAKTNCVRIVYADNYHIDFAIYRRIKNEYDNSYIYEHAGSEWRSRDPRAINNWFKGEITTKGEKLRQAIRLIKTFCKSRLSWKMPAGLIQTVLCDEKIQNYTRIDEMFYYTICAIKDRLMYNKEIYNPVDTEQSLLLVKEDRDKMDNLYNRLNTYIQQLDILFDNDCTEKKALEAWKTFFNHEYWIADSNNLTDNLVARIETCFKCDDTEEYIENIYPVQTSMYFVKIDCKVLYKNGNAALLSKLLEKNEMVKIGCELEFFIEKTNVPGPYDVFWKVKNVGLLAEKNNCIRGQLFASKDKNTHKETAEFEGNHYVECYIIKNKVCVAKGRIDVPIFR